MPAVGTLASARCEVVRGGAATAVQCGHEMLQMWHESYQAENWYSAQAAAVAYCTGPRTPGNDRSDHDNDNTSMYLVMRKQFHRFGQNTGGINLILEESVHERLFEHFQIFGNFSLHIGKISSVRVHFHCA